MAGEVAQGVFGDNYISPSRCLIQECYHHSLGRLAAREPLKGIARPQKLSLVLNNSLYSTSCAQFAVDFFSVAVTERLPSGKQPRIAF
jgi:hypothetical protein